MLVDPSVLFFPLTELVTSIQLFPLDFLCSHWAVRTMKLGGIGGARLIYRTAPLSPFANDDGECMLS